MYVELILTLCVNLRVMGTLSSDQRIAELKLSLLFGLKLTYVFGVSPALSKV